MGHICLCLNNPLIIKLTVSQLLDINEKALTTALLSNTQVVNGEEVVSLKRMEQANDGRDALAKSLYARLFGWIVQQVNRNLQPDENNPSL